MKIVGDTIDHLAGEVDQAFTALLKDIKAAGLLPDTLRHGGENLDGPRGGNSGPGTPGKGKGAITYYGFSIGSTAVGIKVGHVMERRLDIRVQRRPGRSVQFPEFA